jgi:hypothetical protein
MALTEELGSALQSLSPVICRMYKVTRNHRALEASGLKCKAEYGMNPSSIADELCDLLQLQLNSIMGRKLTEFTPDELDAYQERKARIAELRTDLHQLAYPT